MAAEDEIRQASEQFYAALNPEINDDPGPMMGVWSHNSDVSTMHTLDECCVDLRPTGL
jgi:hypothetical protein